MKASRDTVTDMDPKLVFEEALRLPRERRAALAGALLSSLDEEPDVDRDAAWADTIEERLAAVDRGEAKVLSEDELLLRLSEARAR